MKPLVALIRNIAGTLTRKPTRSYSKASRHQRFRMESLETRMLLSADPAALAGLLDEPDPLSEPEVVLLWAEIEGPAADSGDAAGIQVEKEPRADFINLEAFSELHGPSGDDMLLGTESTDTALDLEIAGALFSLEMDEPLVLDDVPVPADALTNNNAGATGISAFTQSETTVIAFGSTVVVGFNDSGSAAAGPNRGTGWARSTDGGVTFIDGGTLPANPGGDRGDPVLARNETTGRIYFSTLGTSTIQMFRSDDGGATWMLPVNATPGGSGEDKQWHAVDNFAGPGNGNVYLVSRRFGGTVPGIYFFRSTDHGATFGPTGGTLMVAGSQGAFVTVGTDHSVYVFWWAGSTIQMRKSTDFGLTFGAPVTVASGLLGFNGDLLLTGIRQGTATPSSFRSNEFPHAAVNPVNGNIYVTYNNDVAGTDRADVFVVQSTDGGATWSAPLKVNDDSTTTDQWQPTLAVSTTGDKLGIFYSSRQEDPGNNLFKYYGRIANISGSTLTFTPSFAISDTASLPEFGRDAPVNSVYMGDYNTAAATPGFFHVTWSDNRDDLPGGGGRKDPNVYYDAIDLGLAVRSTSPAVGSVVVSPSVPLDYVVNFSDPIQAATVNADDFRVDGIAANSFVINSATQVTFRFLTAPFLSQGVHTMTMAAGVILRDPDGDGLGAFSGNFRYDAVPLLVTSTVPPINGAFTLPAPFIYDVNFSEAVNPVSVQTWDLVIGGMTGAVVTSVTVLPGNTTARFTLSGITEQGSLSATIMAGGFTDAFGNPNAAFSASYAVDITTAPYPSLDGKLPLGSLIYDPTISGIINFAGDSDKFTLNIDPGQTISVILTPTAPALTPRIELFDPNNVSLAFALAPGPGQIAAIQTQPATLGGLYTFDVTGAAGSLGGYTLQVILNSAFELEGRIPGNTNNALSNVVDSAINAADSGWIQANGTHTAPNNNYLVGFSTVFVTTEYRNYFTFTLPAATPTIASAELRLFNSTFGYTSPDPAETYTLYDVSATPAELDTTRPVGDVTGMQIHSDLGSGTIYGTRTVSATDNNTTVAIPLNAAAIAALNAAIGSTISIGGAITTLTTGITQTMFGGTSGALGQVQLVLQSVSPPQSMDSSLITVSTPQASAQRAAMMGQTDVSNYAATAVPFTFEDISATGTVITPITNQDNLSVTVPIGFTFPFYGVNNNLVFVSSNGLLTFGTGFPVPANTDLTTTPTQATIAPFWDDLHTGGGVPGSNVFFQTIGSGANQHLTIQWNNVRFFSGGGAGDTITFQVQLYADGRIQFNYLDLTSGAAAGNNGGSATVGVKAAGTQGSNRLLLALNNGPNAFVGTGRSTLLTRLAPTPDYYAFSVNAGDTITLGVSGDAAANFSVELRDASDAVLATGVGGATNLSRIISDFQIAAGGTYYARVTGGNGSTSVPYIWVLTKNAEFDTEDNNTAATAQSLNSNHGVLGHTGGGTTLYGSTRAGQLFTINLNTAAGTLIGNLPIPATEIEFDNLTGRAFAQAPDGFFFGQEFNINTGAGIGPTISNGASFNGMEWVGSTLYATAIPGPGGPSTLRTLNPFTGTSTTIGSTGFGPIAGLAYNNTAGIMYGITGGPTGSLVRINLTTGAGTLIGSTGFRAGSLEFGPDGLLYAGGTGPDEFKIFRINPTTGASTLVGMTGIGATGTADVTGLALVVTGSDDWFFLTVPLSGNALRLETSTPGDGPGNIINTLNPKIELYDTTGTTLIASGVAGPDGRNEFIAVSGLTPGATYKVRVSGEGGTRGEYFLTRNFSPVLTALTVSSPINENGTATLSGTLSDVDALDTHTVVINWGPGEGSTTLTLAAGVFTFSATHQYLDDNPTGTLSDVYTIGLTVTDNHLGSNSQSVNLTVNNVSPVVASISGPSTGVAGQVLDFSSSFTDVGTQDTHQVRWDFGDGTFIDFHSTADPGALTAAHVYTAYGVYTVTLSIRDDDGGLTAVTKTVTVTAAALQVDPCDPNKTALVVGGTAADDTIHFSPGGNSGDIVVHINGVSQGVFRPTGHIIVYGQAGDDDIQVAGSIVLEAWLFGDAGNDRLKSGAGASILMGGDGDDFLNGGSGRSILIGGRGKDRLVGASGDDILIGGDTVYEGSALVLCALVEEWNSGENYETRVARLRLLLNATTVLDDGEVDMLTG
ncbi:MAG TPA: PKD domain-containing protein, partial [Terriglobia bacterium]|nr:PKD domain-containing protein [Terriglobia bacterium]